MDYDYGQEQPQFRDNGVDEEGEDDYDETQHQIGVSGNGREQFSNRDSASQGKLFVGGVSWETTADTFSIYFGKYGEISDAVIMTDRHSGRPRGFGFVTFADPAVADRVLEEEHIIDGRAVEVKRTVPREEMDTRGVLRAKKIFVGGIPPNLTGEEMKEYFSNYGNVVDCQIMLDHQTGRSRGFGFVTFDSEDSVEDIFSESKTHELGGKRVEIKKAVPKRNGDHPTSTKAHTGFGNRTGGYDSNNTMEGPYAGKMGGAYGVYNNGYGGYNNGYGMGNGFYGGYGAYCYGYGYGGPVMYGYGAGGYGGYGAAMGGYGGGRGGYGRSPGGGNGGGGSGSGGRKGYEGSESGGGGSVTSRYHPYQK